MGRLKDRFSEINEYDDEQYYEEPASQHEDYGEGPPLPPNFQSDENKSPLSILDEIKKVRTPKGTFATMIHGIPVDLHALEDYIIRISPYNIKTLMRYHNARTLEEIKGYSRYGGMKVNSKAILIILLAVGMAVGGIFLIFFMPKILQSFQMGL